MLLILFVVVILPFCVLLWSINVYLTLLKANVRAVCVFEINSKSNPIVKFEAVIWFSGACDNVNEPKRFYHSYADVISGMYKVQRVRRIGSRKKIGLGKKIGPEYVKKSLILAF